MRNKTAFDRLYPVIQRQSGYFTAQQARLAGLSTQSHYYYVRIGDWIRVARGIFRLKHFPMARYSDLMTTWLWTCDTTNEPRGVFSYDTAFSLYPYSVWIARETHVTVPPGFRRRAESPRPLRRHVARLHAQDVMKLDGVPVTTLVRTIVDFLASGFVQQHYLREYLTIALHIGFVQHHDFLTASLDDSEWELLLEFLEKCRYERKEELQVRRRLQAGA